MNFFVLSGNYCEEATVNPVACPTGTYMPNGTDSADPTSPTVGTPAGSASDCEECPAGSRCEAGVVNPTECGVGFFTAPRNSVCQRCLPG